jgi:hypothetical protein
MGPKYRTPYEGFQNMTQHEDTREIGLGNLLFENDPQYFFNVAAITPASDAGQSVGGRAKALCGDYNVDLVGLA